MVMSEDTYKGMDWEDKHIAIINNCMGCHNRQCQCRLCQAKETPRYRGTKGACKMSNPFDCEFYNNIKCIGYTK